MLNLSLIWINVTGLVGDDFDLLCSAVCLLTALMAPAGEQGMRASKSPRQALLVAFGLSLSLVAGAAQAGKATGSAGGWVTTGGVKGTDWEPGSTVTITYANGVVVKQLVHAGGRFFAPQPTTVPDGTAFVVTGTEGDGTAGVIPGTLAAVFRPPMNRVLTTYTVLADSTVEVAGLTGGLTGGFRSYEDGFDSDPLSPTFGDLSGFFVGSALTINSAALDLQLGLAGDYPFVVNIADLYQGMQQTDFVSGSVLLPDMPIDFVGSYQGNPFTASGMVSGVATVFLDQLEMDTFNLTLSSSLGDIHATIYASAHDVLTPVPEPRAYALMIGGFGLLGFALRRRRNGAGTREVRERYA